MLKRRRKKEEFYMGANQIRAFSVVIVVTVVLSVFIGIVPAENVSFTVSVGYAQNIANAVGDSQELFIGDAPFKIKIPAQNEERLKAPEKRLIGIPQEGGGEASFPRVAQPQKGLRVFEFTRNATRGVVSKNFVNESQSNESRNIHILETAQDEASTANHKLKENGGIDLEITKELEPKSDYKISKEIVSGLTDQPTLSTSSIEGPYTWSGNTTEKFLRVEIER
ncbi:MAG TPA: hypothetical protein VMW67_04365 [Desulfobacteria bacterium]|nr:hypothetical protein [Desulfobacteria bacterium]